MKIKCTFKNYDELIAFAKDILQKEAGSDKASQEQPNYIPLVVGLTDSKQGEEHTNGRTDQDYS